MVQPLQGRPLDEAIRPYSEETANLNIESVTKSRQSNIFQVRRSMTFKRKNKEFEVRETKKKLIKEEPSATLKSVGSFTN
jgi:hypothetical protein